ncbi:GIY-YIG nuclease family protein [Patescibacteria group bacterium]|nr:GIY-YIG nuclease family protein [Patescibacteria group bacterium]
MTNKQPTVYILASKPNGTIYVGVTSNLSARIHAHKTNAVEGFTKKYGVHTLVYAEAFETMNEAILREKQLKAGSRKKKVDLIEKNNPGWVDISDKL